MTPTLYHKTSLSKANSILEENAFRLSTWLGTKQDHTGTDHAWFLSTSTEPGAYSRQFTGVVFVLDGDKLAHDGIESIPFDYWGETWRKQEGGEKYDEKEERLLSHNPKIKNASSYIKEIHADWWVRPKEEEYSSGNYARVRKMALLAKKRNIPLFWYESEKDLDTLDKSKSKPFSSFEKRSLRSEEQLNYRYSRESLRPYTYKQWKALLSVYPAKKWSDLSPDIYKLSSYSDGHTGFMADIHNATKKGNDPIQPYIYKMQKQMKLSGAKDFKEFYWMMMDKIHKLREEKSKSFKEKVTSRYRLPSYY